MSTQLTTPVLIAIGSGVVIAGLAGVSAVTAMQRPAPSTTQLMGDPGMQVQAEPLPTPVVTPTVAASPEAIPTPSVAPTPAPAPITPAPDGTWFEAKSVPGYTHWHFRTVPGGQVTGYIPFNYKLYSDRRRQDGWIAVLCPPELCQQPTWGWMSMNALTEVKQ